MKIQEMTMRGPNLDAQAERFIEHNKNRWFTQSEYIADIETYKVLQDGIYYSLWDDTILVAVCSLSDVNLVDNVYVNPEYRGKKIFSMMLWFFKTRLNRSPLMLGEIHSKDMLDVIQGLSRFRKYWYNIKTEQIELFSLDTLDNFYSYLQPTNWRLMLENTGEFNWPRYNGDGFIKESYSPWVD